ncbi:hypothetical protein FGG08_002503 [Glutinoglossum americanum]|uniref:Uncharacterized protein n=1 Tax=Glutinoglossum americanum TaxID=1670608 RepID=A0A9P8I4J9_9PEZI|nr:hypothetical protein FGG08_002503 [Glutinoglossum americanum]
MAKTVAPLQPIINKTSLLASIISCQGEIKIQSLTRLFSDLPRHAATPGHCLHKLSYSSSFTKMASNSPNEPRRNGSTRRADAPPSASTPLRPSGNTYPQYRAINPTSSDANSSRSSLASSTPLVAPIRRPTAPTSPPHTEPPPTTPPAAPQRPVASRQTTSQPAVDQPAVADIEMRPVGAPPPQKPWEEWKSWKIRWPWLSFLLFIVVSLIGVVATLDTVSRRNSGFARLSKPPAFLARNPALEKAIWLQGIVYTALPAFIMTVYRTMWESAVTAFADRQPYIDLKKRGGRSLQTTLMVDYKAEPLLYGWFVALRNKHFLLAACMFFSVVLVLLVVPLTSFLFTTVSFASNTILPLSFKTSFNSDILEPYPNSPDLRLLMDSAAAMRLLDARQPPWTDSGYAFAKFDPSIKVGNGSVTLETTAYSAQSGCIYIPESQYHKTILTPGETGIPALSIQITADDRGCQISSFVNLELNSEHPTTFLKVWPTLSCASDVGWSRFSILTGQYTNASAGMTNFSLISCTPSYWITSGKLVTVTDPMLSPFSGVFTPHPSNASQFRPDALWRFFEKGIQDPGCFDPLNRISDTEFGRYVYKIASKENPASPLVPEAVINASHTLFATTFAVFASTALFRLASSPLNGTGIHSAEETRLIVVSLVAYIVLGVLAAVAILNISLFFYARQESMLYEKPVGLLSMAGILHNSDVMDVIDTLAKRPNFNGKPTEALMKEGELVEQLYQFNEEKKRIVNLMLPQT